jgi:Sulfotransferase family
MRFDRRWIRNFVGQLVGVQGDLQVWWTPGLPLVYIANPKAGCSTIKHSLKEAQAAAYTRSGRCFKRIADEPHLGDACLRRKGLTPKACRRRYLISCVRNPFARALSGYLDKVRGTGTRRYPELRHRRIRTFEDHLRALADYKPRDINPHFRPQRLNLDLPRLSYDTIFFLENLVPLSRFLAQIHPGARLETFAPHSRGAAGKLREHYTDRTLRLVREIYTQDFEAFGYSEELDAVGTAPGDMITADGIVPAGTRGPVVPERPLRASPGVPFETALRFRWFIDQNLI